MTPQEQPEEEHDEPTPTDLLFFALMVFGPTVIMCLGMLLFL